MSSPTGREHAVTKIRGFLVEECYVPERELANDVPLFTSGRLGSLDMIDLSAFLETEFGLEVADSDVSIEHFDTVDMIADYVAANDGA